MTMRNSRRHFLQTTAAGVGLSAALGTAPAAVAAGSAPGGTATSGRRRDTFDFDWKFTKGDPSRAQAPEFADGGWDGVDLPHDWSIREPFDQHNPSGAPGAYLPGGVCWYRKRFRPDPSLRGQRVTLNFDGVHMNSTVWINGHRLGERPYGFVPFSYDLTPHLSFDGDNVVAVRVDTSRQPNCRWYPGSGIYRHTWLIATDPVHVAENGTFVRTPMVSDAGAVVETGTTIANESSRAVTAHLTTTLLDATGADVAHATRSVEVQAGKTATTGQQLSVPDPRLWSPATPYLYTARTGIQVDGRLTDHYDTPFGIRSAVFDAERGFLLNGTPVKLNGVCVHPDAGCLGTAVAERVWERRLELLKAMGCNAVRTAHNPREAEFLDLCDRMGLLVMAEAFDEWTVPKPQIAPNGYSNYFAEWHEADLTAFIHRDRNHPSVILWSAGNEVGDQAAADGAGTLAELTGIFHREDPTRQVTVACDRIMAEPLTDRITPEFLAGLDVVGYNYVDRWRDRRELYYTADHEAHPDRPVIGTESSALRGARGDTSAGEPGSTVGIAGTVDVEQLWKFVRDHDYVSGDHMWVGIDYLGEATWPAKGATSGQLDTCGFPKDGYYFYQSQWTTDPVLHLFPHWNWTGREGELVTVRCFTNCDTVELFLDGRSLGTRGYAFPRLGMQDAYGTYPPRALQTRTTGDLHLTWDVPYRAGTLKAVGSNLGKVVATAQVSTTGRPAAVALTLDRGSIHADRRDVCHVTARIVDERGLTVPTAADEVTFDVRGPGRLIGVDNGDQNNHDSYQSPTRAAYNGRCLAIVRSTAEAGAVDVAATAPGLRAGRARFHTS